MIINIIKVAIQWFTKTVDTAGTEKQAHQVCSFCLMRHLCLFAKDLTFLAQKNYQNFFFFFTILLKSNTIKV